MFNFIKFIFIAILIFYVITYLYSSKYYSPYKVYVIFGKKRVGKSTDIVKRALKYQKKGYRTFCSEKDVKVCEYFDPLDFGKFTCNKSVFFLDEAGLIFHKRDFADKSRASGLKAARNFTKMCGHDQVIIYIYSQSWDIDMSLKENADALYYYTKLFNIFTYGRKIDKGITLTSPDADRPGMLADTLTFVPFFHPGSRVLNFIPRYSKYFDSFKPSGLPSYEEYYHLPRDVQEAEGRADDTAPDADLNED